VAKVEIGCGGIEAKFDAEEATRGDFFRELLTRMDVGETRKKGFRGHGMSLTALERR
jgi:hypothetical protein